VGRVNWLGAWGAGPTDLEHQSENKPDFSRSHDPYFVPPLPEGAPHTLPLDQDAAHFLIAQVHAHPHQVTICALGPLTNIALALAIDPHFAELTRGIVMMGSSLNPQTADPEFTTSPRHEFNFWFDPEAAHIVLRAHWPRIDVTTVDVSVKAPFTQKMVDQIAQSQNPAARYIASYSQERYYLWDEFAACAWLDASIVTGERQLYMDVDLSHGPSYGETLTWTASVKPDTDVQLVHAQVDLDLPKFTNMFVNLMKAPPLK
jgi:inosine-uridine nucleoside N-ribohydrolase